MKQIIPIALCMFALVCCKSKKVITDEPVILNNTYTDSIYKSVWTDNSLTIRDTFIIVLNSTGDTIKEKEIHTTIDRQAKSDTLYINSTDTIKVPVEITRQTTKTYIPKFIWYVLVISLIMNIGLIISIWIVLKKAGQH